MRRFISTMGLDVRLQFRYGLYLAGLFVAVTTIVALKLIPKMDFGFLLPAFLFFSVNVTTFYFIAGQVLFEKGEGTLEPLVVTPLRTGEYLGSKVITLTFLALWESLAIVVFIFGLDFNFLLLISGITLMGAIYCLIGFILIARYDSINRFLMPSSLFVIFLQLPIIDYLGLWESRLFYVFPLQAPLMVMKAAFVPIETWQLVYGVLYSVFWIGALYFLAQRTFLSFIIRGEGGKIR